MLSHDQFEELAALAGAGEISREEWESLRSHLDECAACKAVFAEVGQIQAKWLPERPDFEIPREPSSDARLRRSILRRVASEGAQFSRAALVPSRSEGSSGLGHQSSRWLLAVAAVVVIGASTIALLFMARPVARSTASESVTPAVRNGPGAKSLGIESKEHNNADQARIAEFQAAFKRSEARRESLQRELDAEQNNLRLQGERNKQAVVDMADLRQQLEVAQAQRAESEAALRKAESEYTTANAVSVVQQQEIRGLSDKLRDQTASLDRERQLLVGGREIRDLIAARNLHIIDVYDTNGRGKTGPAFGRVFYTENTSLVFYAYDLKPESGKYAFHIWGTRDGALQDIKSLGTFSQDDQAQKRWVFTTTDPRVLAEIDSVFVTLEPVERAGNRPSGKRLLSAFLGTPANHP